MLTPILYTVEPLYSGHPYSGHIVIVNRFSRNRPNPGQTLIANRRYSGHYFKERRDHCP